MNAMGNAGRSAMRRPLDFAVSVMTLAFAVGLLTALGTFIEGIYGPAVPYRDPTRLVEFIERGVKPEDAPIDRVSRVMADALSLRDSSFEAVSWYQTSQVLLKFTEFPDNTSGVIVPHQFFSVLGVKPFLGRAIDVLDEVPGGHRVAVLTYGYWLDHFGGDTSVVGKSYRAFVYGSRPDTELVPIVGVMPANFVFPGSSEIYLSSSEDRLDERAWTDVIARRKGRTRISELHSLCNRVAEEFGAADRARMKMALEGSTLSLPRANRVQLVAQPVEFGPRDSASREMAIFLLVSAVLVLVLALANVVTLAIVGATARRREFACRLALGSTRMGLIRLVVADVSLLGFCGLLAGAIIAKALLVITRGSEWGAMVGRVTPQSSVLAVASAVTAVLTLAAAVTAGYVITGQVTTESLSSPEGSGFTGRRERQVHSRLLIAELAISYALVFWSGLLVYGRLGQWAILRHLGASSLLVVSMVPDPSSGAAVSPSGLLERFRAAGIGEAVGLGPFPTHFRISPRTIWTDGGSQVGLPPTAVVHVSYSYFAILRLHILRGDVSALSERTGGRPDVVVLSRSVYERLFSDRAPANHLIKLSASGSALRIAGVVEDLDFPAIGQGGRVPVIYLPVADQPGDGQWLLVRLPGVEAWSAERLRRVLRNAGTGYDVASVESGDEAVQHSQVVVNGIGYALDVFAVGTLLVVLVGVYAVVRKHIFRRRREMGVRLALGASPTRLTRQVLLEVLGVWAGGIIAGAILAQLGHGALLLLGIGATTTITLGAGLAVSLGLVLVAIAALTVYPTAQTPPVRLLRSD